MAIRSSRHVPLLAAALALGLVGTAAAIAANPATAPSTAPAADADALIAAIKAVELPELDQTRLDDQAYVERFMAEQHEALLEQMRRRQAFVRAYPTHRWAAGSAVEIVRKAGDLKQPLGPVVQELLALPLAADTKILIRMMHAEQVAGGEAPDFAAATRMLDELKRELPGDERISMLAFMIAENALRVEGADRMRAVAIEYPNQHGGKMAAGWLTRMDGIGKPFELAFDDVTTGRHIDVQKDLRGKIVVIDFWATWCGPCVAEMPRMKTLYEQYRQHGVEFIGVSLDLPQNGGQEKVKAFVQQNGIGWPQFFQGASWDGAFSMRWGINAIPAVFVVDADGKLVTTEARGLEPVLDRLLARERQSDPATQPATRPAAAAR